MGEEKPATPDARAALGVTAAATRAQVVTAFRRQARQVHPDVSHARDASDQFAALVAAYDVALRAARSEPNVTADPDKGRRSETTAHLTADGFHDVVTGRAGTFIYESGRPVMVVGPTRVDGPPRRSRGGDAHQARDA